MTNKEEVKKDEWEKDFVKLWAKYTETHTQSEIYSGVDIFKFTNFIEALLNKVEKEAREEAVKPKYPKRRYVLDLKLHADALSLLINELENIAQLIERGSRDNICGSPGLSYIMRLTENSDMTHEKYFKEIDDLNSKSN